MTARRDGFAAPYPPVWVVTWSAFEVEMEVFGTAGIEGGPAGRAGRIALRIFVYRKLCTAGTAEDHSLDELILWPNGRGVIGRFGMAFETRIPVAAASEPDRDDVERGVPVGAAGFGIDVDAVHLLAVDKPDHLSLGQSIR